MSSEKDVLKAIQDQMMRGFNDFLLSASTVQPEPKKGWAVSYRQLLKLSLPEKVPFEVPYMSLKELVSRYGDKVRIVKYVLLEDRSVINTDREDKLERYEFDTFAGLQGFLDIVDDINNEAFGMSEESRNYEKDVRHGRRERYDPESESFLLKQQQEARTMFKQMRERHEQAKSNN